MTFEKVSIQLVFVLAACCISIMCQNAEEEDQTLSNKVNSNMVSNRLAKYSPDMRLVLNGLLRYENSNAKRPDESYRYPLLHIANRSKGSAPTVDDPLAAALATGFLGSRGKRNDYDEIPVFANGFPAGRG